MRLLFFIFITFSLQTQYGNAKTKITFGACFQNFDCVWHGTVADGYGEMKETHPKIAHGVYNKKYSVHYKSDGCFQLREKVRVLIDCTDTPRPIRERAKIERNKVVPSNIGGGTCYEDGVASSC